MYTDRPLVFRRTHVEGMQCALFFDLMPHIRELMRIAGTERMYRENHAGSVYHLTLHLHKPIVLSANRIGAVTYRSNGVITCCNPAISTLELLQLPKVGTHEITLVIGTQWYSHAPDPSVMLSHVAGQFASLAQRLSNATFCLVA